jgi:transcriptional regulator with XRE-family HTH domain
VSKLVTKALTSHQIGDSISAMQLADYLKTNGISDEDFGQLIGVTRQTVHRYKNGRFPETPVLSRILEVTAGAVAPNDFLPGQSANATEQQGAA